MVCRRSHTCPNDSNFDAHCSWNGLNNSRGSFDNNTYLHGDFDLFQEWSNAWVGMNGEPFAADSYIQVDLGRPRWIAGVTTLWSYIPAGFEIQASLDGTTFEAVELGEPWKHADRVIHYDFASSIRARYVRLVNADNSVKGHALMDRIMVYGGNAAGTVFILR